MNETVTFQEWGMRVFVPDAHWPQMRETAEKLARQHLEHDGCINIRFSAPERELMHKPFGWYFNAIGDRLR